MQVNKPYVGVFKGMGALQNTRPTMRKTYEGVRNQHQFDLTHRHPNQYRSMFKHFHTNADAFRQAQSYLRVRKNANQSSIAFANSKQPFGSTINKSDYLRHQGLSRTKPIYQKEQGIKFNQMDAGSARAMSTMKDHFKQTKSMRLQPQPQYNDTRMFKYNPITGQQQSKSSAFPYQDFSMNAIKNYRAHNCTIFPKTGQRIDIITGRVLK